MLLGSGSMRRRHCLGSRGRAEGMKGGRGRRAILGWGTNNEIQSTEAAAPHSWERMSPRTLARKVEPTRCNPAIIRC